MPVLDTLIRSARHRVESFGDEVEIWKAAHDEAMTLFDLRDELQGEVADGIALYARIIGLDLKHRRYVAAKKMPWNQGIDTDIWSILRLWMKAAETLLGLTGVLAEKGFQIEEGEEKLRKLTVECKSILSPDDEYFGPGLGDACRKAIESNRASKTEALVA